MPKKASPLIQKEVNMNSSNHGADQNPLGEKVQYSNRYDPKILYRIERAPRSEFNFQDGFDRWVAYEFTWLTSSGCPKSCALEIIIPASTKFIVESKSLKLYLGGFSQEQYPTEKDVLAIIRKDLCLLLESEDIRATLLDLESSPLLKIKSIQAASIDDEIVHCTNFTNPSAEMLKVSDGTTTAFVYSNLFRSLCPVTGQPDYATIFVKYKGNEIKADSLLQYLVAYRNHAGFHETCCEKIFADISEKCRPEQLTVACFFSRRGGIDINPVRSSVKPEVEDFIWRCARQ